ncbi:glycosyltransferase family 2 protein [Chryseobacterium zhengzhouense]|uniref:Glycosyltransferase family 2 protein n=1 Tax=Chryseobacterium zhengzhouense TaxID=1636086 RepID=A0ABW2M2F7_9FLAO
MREITILMSTYNGEKFLKEQLNSIINQDYKCWNLYIRDDGSTDSTLHILNNYVSHYQNIHLLNDDRKNMGAAQSFMYLLREIQADFYMFCDQDDMWLPSKISSMVDYYFDKSEKLNSPYLIFSDAIIVDEDLMKINDSFWSYNKVNPELIIKKPNYIKVFNCAPGCTMLFNREVKMILDKNTDDILMHDWYILIKVLEKGFVDYLKEPTILYRQHGNNAVGAERVSLKYIRNKILNISKTLKVQLKTFNFVRKHTSTSLFEFYFYKLKFNVKRYLTKI